jgi:hypothetical protein
MRRFVVFALIALIAVALIDPVGHNRADHTLIWVIQIVALIVIIAALCLYLRAYYTEDIKPPGPRSIEEITPVPEGEAYELQKVAGKIHMNALQAKILALAILEPGELRQRVVEKYRTAQRTLEQEVMIEAKIPMRLLLPNLDSAGTAARDDAAEVEQQSVRTAAEGGLLFPIMVIPKGAFNDNLEVFGPGDEQVSVLTYREYLQIIARMLRLLLCLAYGTSTTDDVPKFPQEPAAAADSSPLHLEHRALCEIIKRAQGALEVKRTLGISPVAPKAAEVAGRLEKLSIPDANRRIYLKMAAALVRRLSLHYALVAAIDLPQDRRLLVRYRRTLIPELDLRSAGIAVDPRELRKLYPRFKAWLRVLFGSRPVNVTVSLDNAWTCRSYHVRVEAPDGLYLGGQKLIASQDYLSKKAEDAPTPVHYRFRRRLGQPYAHFYGRFFPIPLPGERRPKIQLHFYEVPPGSDFRAAIASGAAFALIWLVGFVLSRDINLGTDAPALLLVFPGIAASWLGFDTITHRLFDGTLAARLSLALTTFVSLAASGAFILSKSDLPQFSSSMPADISVLGVYRWPWAILLAVACTNTLVMGCRWICDSWKFKYLAERPDPAREEYDVDRSDFKTYADLGDGT